MFPLFTIETSTMLTTAKFGLFTLLTAGNALIGAYNVNPAILPSSTMQGIYSNIQMVQLHQDLVSFPRPETFPIDAINPVDPRGIVVPTHSTNTVLTTTPVILGFDGRPMIAY